MPRVLYCYLLLIICFLPGCFVANGFECSFQFFGPEKAGTFSTYPVPDQTISVGDTVFFDVNQYWEYSYNCEDYGSKPNLGTFITNSENLEFYRQGNSVFMIGKKPGLFTGTVVGGAYLTRNGIGDYYPVFLTFNTNVVTGPVEQERQRARFPSTGRIDSVQILSVEPHYPRIQLLAHYSPEVTINSYNDFSAWWTLSPTLDFKELSKKRFIYDFKDHGGSDNEYYFIPDSLQKIYHGYVEVQAKDRTYGRTFTLDLSSHLD
ncbi:hypothetical protein [Gracilimonas sp.]|uniref:hypothetical protein n=1 Tax=Gracilimonas sp. TaxID=1974203 RepID=UPI0032EAB584